MPTTRHGSATEELLSDDAVNKICVKLTAMLTPTFESTMNNKCATIIQSINEIKDLVKVNSNRFVAIDKRIDDLEQYSRRNNLRVFGVHEVQGEDTDTLLLDLFRNKLNLTITLNELDRSHRVGKPVSGSGRPRPILVKFISYRIRAQIFTNKKMLKGSNYSIKEDLTKNRSNILQEAIKRYGIANAWTRDGRILIKHAGRTFSVTSTDEFPM